MKKLVFAILCLLSIASYGQSSKFTFKLGAGYELPRKTEDLAFIGNQKDGIVNLSMKKDELNIIRFDPITLNQTDEKVIPLAEKTKNFNSEEFIDFGNGNYFWLHSDWDKENKKELLYYDKLDVQNNKMTSTYVKLNETTKIVGNGGFNGFVIGFSKVTDKYIYNYSIDHKKLLISYRLHPESKDKKENHDIIGIQVFDDNLNKLWGYEFTMPYSENDMDNSDYSIDSKGNAYMLAKVYEPDASKKERREGKSGFHFEVLKFSKDSKEIVHTTIDKGDYFIKEASLIENANHDMVIACTYSKKSKGNGTDGIFLATINASGEVVKYKNGYYEFPLADLEKFQTERAKRKMERKDDYEEPNLKVRDIVTAADGSILITCEECHVDEITYTDSHGFTTTTYVYYYEGILASKINAAGQFEWLRKIPKKQKGTNSYATLGFKLVTDATGYYFLYLDNKKNMELADDEAPKYHVDGFGGQVVVSKIDMKGNVSKELLFDTRDEKVMIFPADFSSMGGNQFIGRAKLKERNTFSPLLITVK